MYREVLATFFLKGQDVWQCFRHITDKLPGCQTLEAAHAELGLGGSASFKYAMRLVENGGVTVLAMVQGLHEPWWVTLPFPIRCNVNWVEGKACQAKIDVDWMTLDGRQIWPMGHRSQI